MVKIYIDHSDGRYYTRQLTDAEAADHVDAVHVEDDVWATYLRDCQRDGIWQALWRSIENAQYVRRRERELLPLEDAAREIDRLKAELARAERQKLFFEDEWLRATGRQTRDEHVNDDGLTCVYPQPGCDISTLGSATWHAAATEILKLYDVDRGKAGNRHQGCCCGHAHRLIGPEEATTLRAAGFLVENDAESEESP